MDGSWRKAERQSVERLQTHVVIAVDELKKVGPCFSQGVMKNRLRALQLLGGPHNYECDAHLDLVAVSR